MTVEEAADFAASLPMLVRGMFYEGWNPADVPKTMDKKEFLSEMRKQFPVDTDHSMQKLLQGVTTALSNYISEGEIKDIRSNLPQDVSELLWT